MTFDELLRESKEESEQRMILLVSKMIENGEADAVSHLSEDAKFLSQMYEKYHV